MADCITNTTLAIDILESDEVIYEIEDLVPCKTYRVEIVPQIEEKSWQGDPLESVLHSCVHILGLDRLCRQLGHICGITSIRKWMLEIILFYTLQMLLLVPSMNFKLL